MRNRKQSRRPRLLRSPRPQGGASNGNFFQRLALAATSAVLPGIDGGDYRGGILHSGIALSVSARAIAGRAEAGEAAGAGSCEFASLQATASGTAIADGCAAEAAGHVANDRAGRETG